MFTYSKSTDYLKSQNFNWIYCVIYFYDFRAGIGDGGNDVGMIQLASIGLGIVGKEGNHAALASDVSIK